MSFWHRGCAGAGFATNTRSARLLRSPCRASRSGSSQLSGSYVYLCDVFRGWLLLRLTKQAGVEACLILGELKMGTDALLAAILSGVLRPRRQPMEFGRAAVTVDDIEQVGDLLSPLRRCTSVLTHRGGFGGRYRFKCFCHHLLTILCSVHTFKTGVSSPSFFGRQQLSEPQHRKHPI